MPVNCVRSVLVGQDPNHWILDSTLYVRTLDKSGRLVVNRYEILPVPLWLVRTYNALLATFHRHRDPTFFFVKSARGAGGFFQSPDLVVVGLEDAAGVANHIFTNHRAYVEQIVNDHVWRHGDTGESSLVYLGRSVIGRLLAHELGHFRRSQGDWAPFDDEEMNADYLAGDEDFGRGKNSLIGGLIFFTIGCNVPGCDHPRSEARFSAYLAGYNARMNAQRLAEQRRQREANKALIGMLGLAFLLSRL